MKHVIRSMSVKLFDRACLVLVLISVSFSCGGCKEKQFDSTDSKLEEKQEKRGLTTSGTAQEYTQAAKDVDDSIDRATRYLLSQQTQDDDLWHSPNYGNLKHGAAMTAFVLYSMSHGDPNAIEDKSRLQAAVDRLLIMVRQRGFVTNHNGPDYTNYGSAMLLLACRNAELNLEDADRDRLIDYLVRSQLDAEEGYAEANVDYGGWDLSGWMTGARPTTGSNTSISATVLEALQPYRDTNESVFDALAASQIWISRLQNLKDDSPSHGGFYFHPKQAHNGNKAGWNDGDKRQSVRSYGSATTDGLRMLYMLAVQTQRNQIQLAIEWLQPRTATKDLLMIVPGFEHETTSGTWAQGLRYYYYQSLSRSFHLFDQEVADRLATQIIEILMEEQKLDGSWINPNAQMREDDPLIATGFCLIALQHCRKWLEP